MTVIEDWAEDPAPSCPAEPSTPAVRPAGTACIARRETSAGGLHVAPQHDAGTTVLALSGELDIASVPLLERHLDDAVTTGSGRVVIDLSHLEFLDSSGLQLLLRTQERLQERGQGLWLRRGLPAVQRLFELTQTVERFRFED